MAFNRISSYTFMSNIHLLTDKYFKLCMARKYGIDPESKEYKLLLKIDEGKDHCLPTATMTDEELDLAEQLALKGWIELIPAGYGVTQRNVHAPRVYTKSNHFLPERYVMLTGGSYALGTFDMDTLREERR